MTYSGWIVLVVGGLSLAIYLWYEAKQSVLDQKQKVEHRRRMRRMRRDVTNEYRQRTERLKEFGDPDGT